MPAYIVFLAEIRAGYQGVANVEAKGGEIVVTERETGRTISLKSERAGDNGHTVRP
jgi:hypothetical protein